MQLFKWTEGRQASCKYEKLCFLNMKLFGFGVDGYILDYQPGVLPRHTDKVDGKHWRLNVELSGRGRFYCNKVILNLFNKIYIFRPDLYTHSVLITKRRFVLSLGFASF